MFPGMNERPCHDHARSTDSCQNVGRFHALAPRVTFALILQVHEILVLGIRVTEPSTWSPPALVVSRPRNIQISLRGFHDGNLNRTGSSSTFGVTSVPSSALRVEGLVSRYSNLFLMSPFSFVMEDPRPDPTHKTKPRLITSCDSWCVRPVRHVLRFWY